jgi:hypothetical protein
MVLPSLLLLLDETELALTSTWAFLSFCSKLNMCMAFAIISHPLLFLYFLNLLPLSKIGIHYGGERASGGIRTRDLDLFVGKSTKVAL